MIPRATYRLQFHKGFTFSDAAKLADYLASLGVSHVYASPILKARAGSLHGYDVIDHSQINPELGGEKVFRAMARVFRRCNIGIIVDIVPNHMAVGQADNAWWLDVLARGVNSAYSGYFDIDWDAPGFRAKILAPFLGASLEESLDKGELKLIHDSTLDQLAFAYYAHRFPLHPDDQERLAGRDPETLSRAELVEIHESQNFVLADWREADSRINWRRFFDITDLAALRAERDDVFDATHEKILELYADGQIDGVRVDHIDGLADPRAYCRRLRAALSARQGKRTQDKEAAYIVVEKILADGETLAADWPIEGTTGYDFMDQVSALQHADDGGTLDALWERYGERGANFDREDITARRETVSTKFRAQLNATACAFCATARAKPIGEGPLTEAIEALVVQMRSYRSYATGHRDSPKPGPYLDRAIETAAKENPGLQKAVEAIAGVFADSSGDPACVDAIRRFNQLSAPVAAKAVEDTAFYRYGRILSRNDVGFDPRQKTLAVADFLAQAQRRAPHAMLTTATHDHKRGEDARARLAVLSELPTLWQQRVERWFARTTRARPEGLASGDEYQLYQTLVGIWPVDGTLSPTFSQLPERIARWCRKYLREAKLRSSWRDPDETYEAKLSDFAHCLLAQRTGAPFREDMDAFIRQIGPAGCANALVQSALRCTLPGVPDLFQGREFWDFSLVDPDNRRAIDYGARIKAIQRDDHIATLAWTDPRRKQALIAALLRCRQDNAALFARGDCTPLRVRGVREDNVVAFARHFEDRRLVVVAARHCAGAVSGTLRLAPAAEWWGATAVDVTLSGLKSVLPFAPGAPSTIRVSDLLASSPVFVGLAGRA